MALKLHSSLQPGLSNIPSGVHQVHDRAWTGQQVTSHQKQNRRPQARLLSSQTKPSELLVFFVMFYDIIMTLTVMSTEAGFITAIWLIKGFFSKLSKVSIIFGPHSTSELHFKKHYKSKQFWWQHYREAQAPSIWNSKKLGFINIPQIYLESFNPLHTLDFKP